MMEWNETLQKLRKNRGLTQEQLAEALFVSRTAVSKWESGRGYPSIDSLKAIAKFFGVTIDELLSGDELLTLAEEDHRQKEQRIRNLVFGLLDCSVVLLLFLPFFGQKADGVVRSVSLLSLTEPALWLRIAYFVVVIGIAGWGLLSLVLQNGRFSRWAGKQSRGSVFFNAVGVLLFIVSLQPYAAALLFLFLLIKLLILVKWP